MARILALVLLFASTAASLAAQAPATAAGPCTLAAIAGSYGIQCFGTMFTGTAVEPATIIGVAQTDANGHVDIPATLNAGNGSNSIHTVGQMTVSPTCFGHIDYTINELLLPGGVVIPLPPPPSADFAVVSGGLEILGAGVVPPGVTGDFVPRLTCRLVQIVDPEETSQVGVSVEASAAGASLPVAVRFHFGGGNPAAGTIAAPYTLAPPRGVVVTLTAPTMLSAGGHAYQFRNWLANGATNTANPFAFQATTSMGATAVYAELPAVQLTLCTEDVNGSALGGSFLVLDPSLGSRPSPAVIVLQPSQPLTVNAPPAIGACSFVRFVTRPTGAVLASSSLHGSLAASQEWVAQYRCPR